MNNINKYISKYTIEEYVYENKDDFVSDDDIRGLVMRLKKKLEGKFIKSKRGLGYKIEI